MESPIKCKTIPFSFLRKKIDYLKKELNDILLLESFKQ